MLSPPLLSPPLAIWFCILIAAKPPSEPKSPARLSTVLNVLTLMTPMVLTWNQPAVITAGKCSSSHSFSQVVPKKKHTMDYIELQTWLQEGGLFPEFVGDHATSNLTLTNPYPFPRQSDELILILLFFFFFWPKTKPRFCYHPLFLLLFSFGVLIPWYLNGRSHYKGEKQTFLVFCANHRQFFKSVWGRVGEKGGSGEKTDERKIRG